MCGIRLLGFRIIESGHEYCVPVTLEKKGDLPVGRILEVTEAGGIRGLTAGLRVTPGVIEIGKDQRYWLKLANFGPGVVHLRRNQKLGEAYLPEAPDAAFPIWHVEIERTEKFRQVCIEKLGEVYLPEEPDAAF